MIVGYRIKATKRSGEVYYLYASLQTDTPWPADRRSDVEIAAAACNKQWNPEITYEVEEVTS